MQFIKSIVSLRGIASLMVCIYHLVLGNTLFFDANSFIEQLSKFGFLGVEIFFIISGFVVPYSMLSNSYQFSNLGKFLYRRSARVEIPYLVSIALVLMLNYLASLFSNFNGLAFAFDAKEFFANIFYLSDFLNTSWYQPLYYTLKIEFQFYIFIGLFLTLILSKNKYIQLIAIITMIGLSFLNVIELFKYLNLFTIGILTFLYKTEKINLKYYLVYVFIILGFLFFQFKMEIVLVSLFSVLYILLMNTENKVLDFLGKISFSLYLIHIPIGGKIINLGMRFIQQDYQKYILLGISLAVSIAFAYLFFVLIESPALKLSKKIKYSLIKN
jgi:peptidoglycan/LPS O-acetylase OafA/YrhL